VYRGDLMESGNGDYDEGAVVKLEADLDASPRTLRFFVDDREQPIFVTNIPQAIHFVVCLCFSSSPLSTIVDRSLLGEQQPRMSRCGRWVSLLVAEWLVRVRVTSTVTRDGLTDTTIAPFGMFRSDKLLPSTPCFDCNF
jgi:hypothetical protein